MPALFRAANATGTNPVSGHSYGGGADGALVIQDLSIEPLDTAAIAGGNGPVELPIDQSSTGFPRGIWRLNEANISANQTWTYSAAENMPNNLNMLLFGFVTWKTVTSVTTFQVYATYYTEGGSGAGTGLNTQYYINISSAPTAGTHTPFFDFFHCAATGTNPITINIAGTWSGTIFCNFMLYQTSYQ